MSSSVAKRRRRPPAGCTARDIRMMHRALLLAARAAGEGEVPVGAVVYREDEVLGEAGNRREASTDPSDHAEIVAMRLAAQRLGGWRLEGCSMAVTLEPCTMCAGATVNGRLARIIYGADDPKAGACRSLYRIPEDARLNHRPEVIGGVLAASSAGLLRAFFRARRASERR